MRWKKNSERGRRGAWYRAFKNSNYGTVLGNDPRSNLRLFLRQQWNLSPALMELWRYRPFSVHFGPGSPQVCGRRKEKKLSRSVFSLSLLWRKEGRSTRVKNHPLLLSLHLCVAVFPSPHLQLNLRHRYCHTTFQHKKNCLGEQVFASYRPKRLFFWKVNGALFESHAIETLWGVLLGQNHREFLNES